MVEVLFARFIIILCLFGCFNVVSTIVATGLESKIKLVKPSSSFVVNSSIKKFAGLLVDPFSKVSGSEVEFDSGKLEIGSFSGLYSGSFNPSKPTTLLLNGSKSFWGEVGTTVAGVDVGGADNQLGGWVALEAPISLANELAVLSLGLQNNLNQNIQLNGGKLCLFSALECNKGVGIVGSGTVDLSEKTIILRSEALTFSGNITWTGAGQIVLYEKTSVSGIWVIDAQTDAITKIDGLGNILDFSAGGSLVVKAGSRVVLDHVVLRGCKTGSIVLEDETAQISVVGCSFELCDDLVFDRGAFVFLGKDSVLITGEYACLFVGGSRLIVDGVSVYFDPLQSSQSEGVDVDGPANIKELNGGRIASIHKRNLVPCLVVDDPVRVGFGRLSLTATCPLWFRGSNSNNLMLQGSGLVLTCIHDDNESTSPLIVVEDNKHAKLRDVVINDFDPKSVSCGSNSEVVWGNNTELFCSRPIVLSRQFNVEGNVILRGCGDVVDISACEINVDGNSSLVLQDVTLVGLGNLLGRFNLKNASSSLVLKNVTLVLGGDYDQHKGKILFQGSSSIIITSNHLMVFNKNSRCIIDGVSVVYDPLNFPDMKNVQSSIKEATNFIYRKGGSLSLINQTNVPGSLYVTTSTYSLQRSEGLLATRPLVISGEANCCELDGNDFALKFPFSREPVLCVESGKKLILKNVVLRDFLAEHVHLAEGASLDLGEDVLVVSSQDLNVSFPINISGSVSFDCNGSKILFDEGGCFVVKETGVLELRNGFLRNLSNGRQNFVLGLRSQLIFQDMNCALSGDFTFDSGGFSVGGVCLFSTNSHVFSYESQQSFVIKDFSTLVLDNGSCLKVDTLSGKGLVFSGDNSSMRLSGSKFIAGDSGMVFDRGKLFVEGDCTVCGGYGESAKGVCFKEKTFDVTIALKASLDLQGLIVHE